MVDFVGPWGTNVPYDSYELTLVVHPSLRHTVRALRGDVTLGHMLRDTDMRHAPSFPCSECVRVRTRARRRKSHFLLILENVQVWVQICADLDETTHFFPSTAKLVTSSGSLRTKLRRRGPSR